MGFFTKNSNETAYVGGKKHWTDVIKNTGRGDLLIWRQPEEDFNTHSTLVVMPGEEALFINCGAIAARFSEPGTYQLSTNNYPFISRLRNAFSGGISTFNCVVYFVRKAHSCEIMWGTVSPIQVRDKVLQISTKLKARGAYKIRIADPAVFLEKLIGSNVPFQTQKDLDKYFVSEFQTQIKSAIASAVNESDSEILGIAAELDTLSDLVHPRIHSIVKEYGLECVSFSIAAIDIDENDLRRQYDEINMSGIAAVRKAQAEKAAMDVQGEAWASLQAANAFQTMINQPLANFGAGAGNAMAAVTQQVFSQAAPAAPQPAAEDPMQVLSKLKQMLDAGLIEQSEYDAKKAEILSRM